LWRRAPRPSGLRFNPRAHGRRDFEKMRMEYYN